MNIDKPQGSHVSGISFLSERLGWVAVSKSAADVLKFNGHEGYILHTSDGGKSWRIQHQSRATQINRIRFINDREGWAVGRKFVLRDTLQSALFVLHTTDQGAHWVDLSDKANKLLADPDGDVQDYLTDVAAETPHATFLTSRGKIIRTADGGQSWQKVAALAGERQQTNISRIGYTPDNRLWILGGADSREGIWGIFVQQESGDSWARNETAARLTDVAYLSATQVLACGSIRSSGGKGSSRIKREGALLYSENGGRKLSIVYQDQELPSINSIAIIDPEHVWAVGSKGLALLLQPLPNRRNKK